MDTYEVLKAYEKNQATKFPTSGTIAGIDGSHIDVTVRGSAAIYRHVKCVGSPTSPGQEVVLTWDNGIPTAHSGVFGEAAAASRFAASLGGRCAVKADGLALGKGVLICKDMAQADAAIDTILVQRAFGAAGAQVVIQELLEGTEISLHALSDGRVARLFPTSQDHKRALDGDRGPNTGGMGTYSPTPHLDETALRAAEAQILKPWVRGCAAEGIDYRGILSPGLMLTAGGPRVLEFNARFGDPETQVYLPRLENDLVEVIEACLILYQYKKKLIKNGLYVERHYMDML